MLVGPKQKGFAASSGLKRVEGLEAGGCVRCSDVRLGLTSEGADLRDTFMDLSGESCAQNGMHVSGYVWGNHVS